MTNTAPSTDLQPSGEPHGRLHVAAILSAVWPLALLWPLLVLLMAALGEWRTILLTPLAWLLAIPVARQCIRLSRNSSSPIAKAEVAIAGGLLGISQALLGMALIYLVTPYRNMALAAITFLVSAAVPATIALLTERRYAR